MVDAFVDLLAAEAAAAAVEQHPEGCEVLHAQLLVRAGRMFEAPPWLLVAARRWLDDGDPEQALAALDRRAEILRGLGRDPSGAEQCLLNLILNAKDATPAGGRISIEILEISLV